MRERHFIRPLFICIMSAIFSISIPQSSLAYEKEIKRLSSTISENIVKAGKKTIAVTDFVDLQGNVNELGRFIAEELSADLLDVAKGFEVIDRTHLKSILAEHKLSMSGLVDPNTVKKLGQITGAEAIVTGSVTPFGDSIRVSAKVIATDTARVIGAGKGDIAKTKAIEELLAKGIEAGTQVTPSVTPAPTTPPAKAQQKVEVRDFIFELQGCKLSTQAVKCSLLVTNKGKDREIGIYGKGGMWLGYTVWVSGESRIFDNFGNEYIAKNAQLSNKEGGSVSSLLVSGIPTKASVSFENVSSEATMIPLFELSCYSGDKFTVQFHNIPLTK